MNLAEVKRVHCLGVGGVGVSAVARLLAHRGIRVSGSDLQASLFTADAQRDGISIVPESAANVTAEINLVIYSDACPVHHPERIAAEQLGIPQVNFATALSWMLAEAEQSVAVAGTNGKSTTTALLGLILTVGGLDPTVVVGSRVPGFNGNIRLGGHKYFVTEADEYRDHFLAFYPTMLVVTNIEHDHVDYFPTIAAMTASFRTLAQQTHPQGHLVINLDDAISSQEFIHDPRVVTFSHRPTADLQIAAVRPGPGLQEFDVIWKGRPLGTWRIHQPGLFNVMNAAAAGAAALTFGIEPSVIAGVLNDFSGIWRRFEILNPGAAITIVSDYAHHPTSIRGVIAGAKEFFPGRRIILAFQPHHHHRLTSLFHFFTRAFVGVDELILCEVYAVAGREDHDPNEKTSRDLCGEVHHPSVHYAADPAKTEAAIRQLAKPGDVVIIMGAGDIWEIGPHLAADYV